MLGCHMGKLIQLTISGGSYQEAMTAILQGIPPGLLLDEQAIYGELLLRKHHVDGSPSSRKEPDIPLITSGINADDVAKGSYNRNHTNGTPITLMIPNIDRQQINIEQYQEANRIAGPGHATHASFIKYGADDDALGAGIFSGRCTAPIVGAGYIAKQVLLRYGITISSYIKEIAGISCDQVDYKRIWEFSERYKKMRRDHDPIYQAVYVKELLRMDMRFLEKAVALKKIEENLAAMHTSVKMPSDEEIWDKYVVHPVVVCPDFKTAQEMDKASRKICQEGDSAGGLIELIIQGLPIGLGEPVFGKLDSELGKLLGIGAIKGVEIGAGFKVKEMAGLQCNDQICSKNGKVFFNSNNAGGLTGGLTTGQDITIRLAVKPASTTKKDQFSIDKYTMENKKLNASYCDGATVANRIWPVAENMAALIILDHLVMHLGYQKLRQYQYT